jgi:hypothetical protein
VSLFSAYTGIVVGCAAIPQHGYFASEPKADYMVTWFDGVNRMFFSWSEGAYLEFDCPSPPALFQAHFLDKLPGGSYTDPLLDVTGYLAACASPGSALGTSNWIVMATLAVQFFHAPVIFPHWIHFMNYGSNAGSFGLVKSGVPFPVH